MVIHRFRKVLNEHPKVDQEFWLVNFDEFGDSALNLFVYYFTTTTSWTNYMQIKQEISLTFMDILDELGVEIAFPSQTLYMRSDELLPKPPLKQIKEKYESDGDSPPVPMEANLSGES
jgi:MscS family membrane protein